MEISFMFLDSQRQIGGTVCLCSLERDWIIHAEDFIWIKLALERH